VSKTYVAIVRGHVARDQMTISRPVGRHPTQRHRMSVASRSGREAVTRLRVLKRLGSADAPQLANTLVCLKPETGRTHQLRVHLASIGHPCLGDRAYGGRAARGGAGEMFSRQALHAIALALNHPRSGVRMEFVASLPHDLLQYLVANGVAADTRSAERWAAFE
ncbi:MAG: RluA family pseudouridine synthase, partial [Candidatus Binataceae bacterium]